MVGQVVCLGEKAAEVGYQEVMPWVTTEHEWPTESFNWPFSAQGPEYLLSCLECDPLPTPAQTEGLLSHP